MGKITRYFLPTDNIDKINIYVVDIEVYFHLFPISHLGHFNILKSILYIEQLVFSQLIILHKSVII